MKYGNSDKKADKYCQRGLYVPRLGSDHGVGKAQPVGKLKPSGKSAIPKTKESKAP